MGERSRLVVLGLDSVTPELIFRRFRSVMPNLSYVLEHAAFGPLRSCDPPITIPAWVVMFTGRDPGSLGLYGFRNRRRGSYFDLETPTPAGLPYPAVWDLLSRAGRRVCVVGMPPGYPPPAVNGIYVSDLLTPPGAADIASPASVRGEIEAASGGYRFDIEFRRGDRAGTARDLFDMTERRWKAIRHLWDREPWDFFAVHEIGPDRLHHAFWKYFDPDHPRHEEHPEFSSIAERYYGSLDTEIGDLLEQVGEEVNVLVTSDHGTQAMQGCFCVNEWLRSKGYLVLKGGQPPPGTPIESAEVDWSRTRVWGGGGYYARLSVNLRGREPHGIVNPSEVGSLREELGRELQKVARPDGRPLGIELYDPASLYEEVRGTPPDLFAYFGGLAFRSAGTVGHGSWFLEENDTGPDDAVHDRDGILIATGPSIAPRGPIPRARIADVAPTILKLFGLPRPPGMSARPVEGLLR